MPQAISLPHHSALASTPYHYADSFVETVPASARQFTQVDAAKAFFSTTPGWIKNLMKLRNKLVAPFGLKVDPGKVPQDLDAHLAAFEGKPGEKMGLFKVFRIEENELIMGEDDKHLDFRVSILTKPKPSGETDLVLSTTVQFNNRWGKLYFLPVKPFHKLIVPVMLKRIVKHLESR